jgi:hypothetical protein
MEEMQVPFLKSAKHKWRQEKKEAQRCGRYEAR